LPPCFDRKTPPDSLPGFFGMETVVTHRLDHGAFHGKKLKNPLGKRRAYLNA